MKHPEIMLGISTAPSLERVFAEETFRLLGLYAVPNTMAMDESAITYPTTDPVNMVAEGTVEVAFRLRGMPFFEGIGYEPFRPSEKYLAFNMQYGELTYDEDMEIITQEDFEWRDYVITVINTEDVDDVCVLDAQTGVVLKGEDLGRAHFNLQAMRDELRSEHYEDEVVDSVIAPLFTQLDKGYGEFRSEEHVELSCCHVCGTENIPCTHNVETLN